MSEETQGASLQWAGIDIEVRFTKNWLNGTAHHLELRAGEPVSVTATGYRSHFLPAEMDVDLDFIFAFLIDWLDEAARSRDWQDYLERSRQGDPFDL
jgi:hypothetical protein